MALIYVYYINYIIIYIPFYMPEHFVFLSCYKLKDITFLAMKFGRMGDCYPIICTNVQYNYKYNCKSDHYIPKDK